MGVPKKIWSFKACRIYTHLSEGPSYFDLMTQPYRKFAAVHACCSSRMIDHVCLQEVTEVVFEEIDPVCLREVTFHPSFFMPAVLQG